MNSPVFWVTIVLLTAAGTVWLPVTETWLPWVSMVLIPVNWLPSPVNTSKDPVSPVTFPPATMSPFTSK